MYERRHTRPRSLGGFIMRMVAHGCVAFALVAVSLFAGMLGYRCFEGMPWLDAFLNASMLLSGMGPVKAEGLSASGKLFAGCYALYSGVAFIAVMGILLAPVVHRILHRFHWEGGKADNG